MKKITAREIVDNILKETKLDENDFAMECKIVPNTLTVAIKRDALSGDIVKKIHDRFGISKEYLKDGTGTIFDGNSTPAIKTNSIDNIGIAKGEVYRKIVEGETEYILIARSVLQEKYRLISIEQIENDKKVLDKLLDQNERMMAKILSLDTKPLEVKKT